MSAAQYNEGKYCYEVTPRFIAPAGRLTLPGKFPELDHIFNSNEQSNYASHAS